MARSPFCIHLASTGPRSIERGNCCCQRRKKVRSILLQRGRAQLSAEIEVLPRFTDEVFPLQRGRAQLSAEIAQRSKGVIETVAMLQRGRAQLSAEIRPSR